MNKSHKKDFYKFFKKVWESIGSEIDQKELSSERALQCILYTKLVPWVKKNGLLLLVEPTLLLKNEKYKPDMVILDQEKIRCIIELKLTKFSKTHNYVAFEWDWIKFYKIFKKASIYYLNEKGCRVRRDIRKLWWFIFAYVDNCYNGSEYGSAVGTKKKVEDFIKLCKPDNEKYRRNRFTNAGMSDLKWLRGKYIHAHGEYNNQWQIDKI